MFFPSAKPLDQPNRKWPLASGRKALVVAWLLNITITSSLGTLRGNSMRTKAVPPLTAFGGDESATISRSWFASAIAPTGNPVSRPTIKKAARWRRNPDAPGLKFFIGLLLHRAAV